MSPSKCLEIRYDPSLHNKECAICIDSLGEGGKLVVHEGENGAKHPIHRSCFNQLVNSNNSKCPTCREDIDLKSLRSSVEVIQRYASIAFGYLSRGVEFSLKVSGLLSISAINLASIALIVLEPTVESQGLLVGSTLLICFITKMHSLLAAAIKGAETGSKILFNHREEMIANSHQVNQIAIKTFLIGAIYGAWKGLKYEFSKKIFITNGATAACEILIQVAIRVFMTESLILQIIAFTSFQFVSVLLSFNVLLQIDSALTEIPNVVTNYFLNSETNIANQLLRA